MFTAPRDPGTWCTPCPLLQRGTDAGDALLHSGKKIKFTKEEDQYLQSLVTFHGIRNWKIIACYMVGRTPRQCRERFKYYLDPGLERPAWTHDEDRLLMNKYKEIGPKWAQLALFFSERTNVDLKNRYNRIMCSVNRAVDALAQMKTRS
jgi:hypothetical protein